MDRAELAPVKYDDIQKSGACFTHLTGIAIVIIAALAAAGMPMSDSRGNYCRFSFCHVHCQLCHVC